MKEKTEAGIQQEIFMWFNNSFCLKFHSPRYCIFSVPNDSSNKEETMRKKATGLISGVSDLIVLMQNKTIFVEIKTYTGVQSDSQKDFQQHVESLGFPYYVCRSLDDFKAVINQYTLITL